QSEDFISKKISELEEEGWTAFDAANYELAESKFAEMIALDLSNSIRLDRSLCLERLRRFDDALREYDRMLELFPDCDAWTYKAILLNDLNLFVEAEMCADNALRLDIKDEDAWVQKGYALE